MTPRTPGTRLLATAAAGALGCAGCCATPAKPADTTVTVTGAVIIAPVLPGDPATAYFTVDNATADADSLTAVSTPASKNVVLNNPRSTGPVTAPLPLPAHSDTALGPNGPDVWLFSPDALRPGAKVPLTITFDHTAPITVQATVRTVTHIPSATPEGA